MVLERTRSKEVLSIHTDIAMEVTSENCEKATEGRSSCLAQLHLLMGETKVSHLFNDCDVCREIIHYNGQRGTPDCLREFSVSS